VHRAASHKAFTYRNPLHAAAKPDNRSNEHSVHLDTASHLYVQETSVTSATQADGHESHAMPAGHTPNACYQSVSSNRSASDANNNLYSVALDSHNQVSQTSLQQSPLPLLQPSHTLTRTLP